MLPSVGPLLESEHVDIAEIACDELSHNVFSIKLPQISPDARVTPLGFVAGMVNKQRIVLWQSHDNPPSPYVPTVHISVLSETNEPAFRQPKVKAIVLTSLSKSRL